MIVPSIRIVLNHLQIAKKYSSGDVIIMKKIVGHPATGTGSISVRRFSSVRELVEDRGIALNLGGRNKGEEPVCIGWVFK
jgi:hypothetical protein